MRKLSFFALVLTTALTAEGGKQALAADDARAIVDKAIKAHGGLEKLSKVQAESWKAKGVMHMGDMKMVYDADYAYQHPEKFRFVISMPMGGQKIELTVVYDGKQAWEKMGDQMREMPEAKLTEFKHSVYVISLSQLTPLLDKAYTLTSLGDSKLGERTVAGVKVTREGRRPVSLFFDKETGLLVKNETRNVDEFSNKEVTQESYLDDYKMINGNLYFHKLTIRRDGKVVIEETFSNQKTLNKPLDEKMWAKP